ncbi:MAG: DUF2304 domain-containing protein [candidate division Zixibacteria bacterium]
MGIRIQILAIIASVGLVLWVIHLVRKRSLRAEYSIVWLIGTSCLLILSLWRELLDEVATLAGVYYAPAILLVVVIFFGVLAFLHLSVVLSRQADSNKVMVQELALLRNRLEEIEGSGIDRPLP